MRYSQELTEPTGEELAQLLRSSFPEMNGADFDEDVDSMDIGSRCGVLIAFSNQFNAWVDAGEIEPIRRALGLIDRLLTESPLVPPGTHPKDVGDHFHNSLLACFVEGVTATTPGFRSLVLPNLGPAVRRHLTKHAPHILGRQNRHS